MSFVWSYSPENHEPKSVREAYVPIKKKKPTNWTAPEHIRMSMDMRRDFPRNEKGQRIEGRPKELKIDKRPTVMIPPRRTRIGWL